jgi:hypothetical protein
VARIVTVGWVVKIKRRGMMAGLLDIFGAFRAGKEVADPTKWKNHANLARMIAAIASTGIVLYRIFVGELPITDEQVITLSGAIATLLMVGSNILAVVTTKKDVSVTGVIKQNSEEGK